MPNQPPRPGRLTRALPYLQLVSVTYSLAKAAVEVIHRVGDRDHRVNLSLSDADLRHLNNGGAIAFTDKSGNEHVIS